MGEALTLSAVTVCLEKTHIKNKPEQKSASVCQCLHVPGFILNMKTGPNGG